MSCVLHISPWQIKLHNHTYNPGSMTDKWITFNIIRLQQDMMAPTKDEQWEDRCSTESLTMWLNAATY